MMGGLPIATPKNVYNVAKKLTQNAGFKNVDEFWTDPESVPPQPPKPSDEEIKAQAAMQLEQMKGQTTAQVEEMKARLKYETDLAAQQAQGMQESQAQEMQARLEAHKAQLQSQLEEQKLRHEAEMESYKLQQEAQLEAMKAQHQKEVEFAKLQAADTLNLRDNQVKLTIAGANQEQKQAKEAEKAEAAKEKETLHGSLSTLTKQLQELHKATTAEKEVVRGPDGRVSGIKPRIK
jgi:hypothetical protein